MNSKPQTAAIRQSIQTEQQAKDELVRELVEALTSVRSLISDGAEVGFNPFDGDWAERLYFSQQKTRAVLRKAGAYNV